MEQERDEVEAMPESERYRGDVKGVEWGVWSVVYGIQRMAV